MSAARYWLAAIAESTDDAIIGKDLNGIVISWNKAATAMFGFSAEEIVGQSITAIIPPERLDEEARDPRSGPARRAASSISRRNAVARTARSCRYP